MLIRRLQAGELELLAPIWKSLLAHHATVAASATRPPEDSWRMRRAVYDKWLADQGSFALVAEEGGAAVGYAMVRVGGPNDTWVSGNRTAELETLAVLPSSRGQGVGSRLMDAVDEELTRLGIHDLWVAVVAGNDAARRFYERRGLHKDMERMYRGRVARDD